MDFEDQKFLAVTFLEKYVIEFGSIKARLELQLPIADVQSRSDRLHELFIGLEDQKVLGDCLGLYWGDGSKGDGGNRVRYKFTYVTPDSDSPTDWTNLQAKVNKMILEATNTLREVLSQNVKARQTMPAPFTRTVKFQLPSTRLEEDEIPDVIEIE